MGDNHDVLAADPASDLTAVAECERLFAEVLAGIVGTAQQVAEKVAAIALAGREQTAGIEQVNRAVADMDEMTQQNAAMVQRVATTSLAMRRNADALLAQVDFFHVGEPAIEEPAIQHDTQRHNADRRTVAA